VEAEELNMPEVKRFWARNYKSLRDVALDFPTKLTAVFGPSGSGKTALAEAFLLLSDASWRRRAMRRHEELRGSVGIEIEHGCSMTYEVRIDGDVQDDFEVRCPHVDVPMMKPDRLGGVVGAALFGLFLRNIVVILGIDWKAVRSPQPPVEQTRPLPDASNIVPYLYTIARGNVPESLVEAVRYVFPDVRGMRFEEKGGNLLLKLAAADGAELDQTNMPAGVLKTLIIETALYTSALLVVDEFENSLHPEAQQFLIDEIRSYGVYAVLMTHSTVVLDYVKTPSEVVLLSLENGETKARRLGEEVKERLKKSGLTLSELIESGLLEAA
jgi:predicted ATPase